MNMQYLAIALLSCLVSSCGVQQVKAIEGEMPFTQGTPTKAEDASIESRLLQGSNPKKVSDFVAPNKDARSGLLFI